MAWIELHSRLKEHPKTYALMTALKVEKACAIGLLACLWLWAIDNLDSGDLTPFPDAAIAKAAEWQKKPDVFVRALVSTGWIEESQGRRALHDWDDYAGRLLEKRRQSRERAQKSRKRSGASGVRAFPGDAHTLPDSADNTQPESARSLPETIAQKPRGVGADCDATVPQPLNTPAVPSFEEDQPAEDAAGAALRQVARRYEEAVGPVSSRMIGDTRAFLAVGMSPQAICAAIDEAAAKATTPSWGMIRRRLEQWQKSGWRVIAPQEDAYRLALDLAELLRGNNPDMRQKGEPELQEWARVFDSMTAKGGIPPGRICEAMEWASRDGFWRKAILTAENLRRSYERIRAQMDG